MHCLCILCQTKSIGNYIGISPLPFLSALFVRKISMFKVIKETKLCGQKERWIEGTSCTIGWYVENRVPLKQNLRE